MIAFNISLTDVNVRARVSAALSITGSTHGKAFIAMLCATSGAAKWALASNTKRKHMCSVMKIGTTITTLNVSAGSVFKMPKFLIDMLVKGRRCRMVIRLVKWICEPLPIILYVNDKLGRGNDDSKGMVNRFDLIK